MGGTGRFLLAGYLLAVGLESAFGADMAFKAPVAPVPFMEIFGGFAADRSSYYGDLGGVSRLIGIF